MRRNQTHDRIKNRTTGFKDARCYTLWRRRSGRQGRVFWYNFSYSVQVREGVRLKVADLESVLDESVPYSWAEEWDNVGLLLGDRNDAVAGVAVALDPSIEAMRMALERGCSVLVTHHPLLLAPLKRFDCSEGVGAALSFAIRNGLSLFSLHTNWDVSHIGVNAVISNALGLREVMPLIPSPGSSGPWGAGAVGLLPQTLRLKDCGVGIKDTLELSRLEIHGAVSDGVSSLALCGGSGGSLWRYARASGADAYFTADMKYHERLEALDSGMALFIADHGEMERFSMKELADTLSEATGLKTILLDPPSCHFCML